TDGTSPRYWLPLAEGIEVIDERDGAATIRIPADMRVDALLGAALQTGRVRYFRYEPPNLTRLFLEAVRPRNPLRTSASSRSARSRSAPVVVRCGSPPSSSLP